MLLLFVSRFFHLKSFADADFMIVVFAACTSAAILLTGCFFRFQEEVRVAHKSNSLSAMISTLYAECEAAQNVGQLNSIHERTTDVQRRRWTIDV